jgi:prepilin-type N-terminal cleavage/methylation domain-containing protein
MTSAIGSRQRTGFTLVEIMITTAILSLGLVMIYQAFFISLDTFDYYLNYLNAKLWLDEKIWQIQDDCRREEVFIPTRSEGEFRIRNKNFNWDMYCNAIEPEELYKVSLRLSWQQGPRRINMLTETYAQRYKTSE